MLYDWVWLSIYRQAENFSWLQPVGPLAWQNETVLDGWQPVHQLHLRSWLACKSVTTPKGEAIRHLCSKTPYDMVYRTTYRTFHDSSIIELRLWRISFCYFLFVTTFLAKRHL